VAVITSADGRFAYAADSSPGDVYAVALPSLAIAWKAHVGGSPFSLLLDGGRLYVSLFAGAAVVELDPSSGARLASHSVPPNPAVLAADASGRVMVAGIRGTVTFLDGTSMPAGKGFAVAVSGGEVWTEDYERAELVRAGDQHRVGLPLPVFPFWLAPGTPGKLLVSAEGADEDNDRGGVFEFDIASEAFTTLAQPRDPDQAVQSGSSVLVAAHGDREVLSIEGGRVDVWARDTPAVALAPVPALGLAVVVVNDHE